MTDKTDIWYIIINPNAGKRRGSKDWHLIARLLGEAGISFEPIFTEHKHHAIDLTRKAIARGWHKFVVVGGDGTMNEVVNGIMEQEDMEPSEITLGMISIGTGNDWARMFGIPSDYAGAVETLARKRTFLQDAGIVRYYQQGLCYKRYFINIAGLGFDAIVVQKANLKKDKGKSGIMVYMRTLLTALTSYRHTRTTLNIDGREFSDDVFTISIGIGKYSGGGIMQTPDAIADDGYFDVTIIRKIGKMDIIRHFRMLFNGRLPEHPKVTTCRARKILIDSVPEIHLEVDGESLGHSPIEIEILKKRIRVVAGEDFLSED
ncbi:MAG: diacylglycerol kinase family lipid kinase [Bacteroidales bacterium]|nr:diacylglycerol kinase family lipid kinase [Bacteroidales bacterium]